MTKDDINDIFEKFKELLPKTLGKYEYKELLIKVKNEYAIESIIYDRAVQAAYDYGYRAGYNAAELHKPIPDKPGPCELKSFIESYKLQEEHNLSNEEMVKVIGGIAKIVETVTNK